MKLTLDQIRSVTVGALVIDEREDGIHFHKCTEKQETAWYAIREILGFRAETTTGIRLDFVTDSPTFSFTVKEGAKFEVHIDSVLCHAFTAPDFETEKTKTASLGGGEHRVTLIFPSHSIGVLQSAELADGASLSPCSYDRKILFYGDSITQGHDSTWDSLSFAYGITRLYNAESVIQGIGGAIFHETTFDPAIDFDPDMVLVAYGTNDWSNFATLEELRQHTCLFLDGVAERFAGKKLFGLSPLWRGDADQTRPMGSFEECCRVVKEEIKAHGLILIEGETLTPHVAGFYSDGYLHPNAAGFSLYTQNLYMQLQKYL